MSYEQFSIYRKNMRHHWGFNPRVGGLKSIQHSKEKFHYIFHTRLSRIELFFKYDHSSTDQFQSHTHIFIHLTSVYYNIVYLFPIDNDRYRQMELVLFEIRMTHSMMNITNTWLEFLFLSFLPLFKKTLNILLSLYVFPPNVLSFALLHSRTKYHPP